MLYEVDAAGEIAPCAADFTLPEGAYTTLRTYDGTRILRLDNHIERLNDSVALQGKAPTLDPGRLREGLGAALTREGLAEARVRLTFAPPRLFVSLDPFEPPAPELYAAGVHCQVVPVRRLNPHAKDTRFLGTAAAAYRALPPGVHEGLLLDPEDDTLLEGLSSNFFAVLDGTLRTEGPRVLAGVTRGLVLELARPLLPVLEKPVTRAELGAASEAFITSVSRGVMPVVRVDGSPIGDGRPGPIATRLRSRLDELAREEARPARPQTR